MLRSQLDHLAITAPTLTLGVEYVRDLLGATPQPGGRHPRMGTHNCLLRLGADVYLEVIAVDPAAEAPSRPRWFRLDRPAPAAPGLAAWVARTRDIRAAAASGAFGRIEPMERDRLRWEITLPDQGDLVLDGVAPMLIQWQTDPHPATALADSGCALVGLEGFHPRPEAVTGLLRAIGFQDEFQVSSPAPGRPPHLVAHIQTPKGLRALTSGALDG
jgi:hypothetical protein